MKRLILSSLVLSCLCGITSAGSLSFVKENTTDIAAMCPTALEVYVDTEGMDSVGTDIIIPVQNDKFKIVGFVPGDIYNMPVGLRQYEKYSYYSAFNVDSSPFNGKGKLGTLYLESRPGIKTTSIEFFVEGTGAREVLDSNIVTLEGTDLLTAGDSIELSFVQGKECDFDESIREQFLEYQRFENQEEAVEYREEEVESVIENVKQEEKKQKKKENTDKNNGQVEQVSLNGIFASSHMWMYLLAVICLLII